MEIKDGQIIETKNQEKCVYLNNKLYFYDESRCYLPYHKYAPGFLVNINYKYILIYYYQKGDLFDVSSYKLLAFSLQNYKCLYKTKKTSKKMLFLIHYSQNKYYFISDRILYFETPEDDIITDFRGNNGEGVKYNYIFTDTIKFLKNGHYYYCPNIQEIANSVKYWKKSTDFYKTICNLS